MEEARTAVEEQLKELFYWLRMVDERLRGDDGHGWVKLLVARLEGVELRMEGDKKHARPHVHVKYKKDAHIASFAIDDGLRLVGDDLPSYYDPIIGHWIKTNRKNLRKLWNGMQRGQIDKKLLLKFQTTVYD
jgi:hypothetical protein